MDQNHKKLTCGEFLVKQLDAYGVELVFGIPGVHTVELYRGFLKTNLTHITPRHEQGAGFMADGYARSTGKVAACFIITGPGMTNILTAMAQAYADSIPMLVISTVNEVRTLGKAEGRLHELKNQSQLVEGVAAFSQTVYSPDELPIVLAKAFSLFERDRPRPVHIEIPTDVMTMDASHLTLRTKPEGVTKRVDPTAVRRAFELLKRAERPFLFLGGGACEVLESDIVKIAEFFDLPVLYTVNAKGVFPKSHPLAIGSYQSTVAVRNMVKESDVILAIGTEIGETDYDAVFDNGFKLTGEMIRVDIDTTQLNSNYLATLGIQGDAYSFCQELRKLIDGQVNQSLFNAEESRAAIMTARVKATIKNDFSPEYYQQAKILEAIQEIVPDVLFVGDSTQIVYSGNFLFEANKPKQWFNSSTGYGTLGYALPAGIGAKLGNRDRLVVVLIGDGGIQFTLPELASAVEEKLNLVIILWNNQGYQEIKRFMKNADIPTIGVDIYTPDFLTIAQGFGCNTYELKSLDEITTAIMQTRNENVPTVIMINEDDYYQA